MKFCEVSCGDFVVWHEEELVVERIYPDEKIIMSALSKCTNFFKYGILPEILGKWYTRLPPQVLTSKLSRFVSLPENTLQENTVQKNCLPSSMDYEDTCLFTI